MLGKSPDADFWDAGLEASQRSETLNEAAFFSEYAERMAKKLDKDPKPPGPSGIQGMDDILSQAEDAIGTRPPELTPQGATGPRASLDDALQADVATMTRSELLPEVTQREYLARQLEAINARHELGIAQRAAEQAQRQYDELVKSGASPTVTAPAQEQLATVQAAAMAAERAAAQAQTQLDLAKDHGIWTPPAEPLIEPRPGIEPGTKTGAVPC